MFNVRIEPLPVTSRFAGSLGITEVLPDVAVTLVTATASPMLKLKDSGVSSGVDLLARSSMLACASNAPISTVCVVLASAESAARANPAPRWSVVSNWPTTGEQELSSTQLSAASRAGELTSNACV